MQHTQRTACLLSKIYAVKTGQPHFDDAKLQNCGKAFVKSKEWATFAPRAQMAELVDALDSKSGYRKVVQVRFLFWAQTRQIMSGFLLSESIGWIPKKTELVDPSSAIQQFLNPFTDLMFCLTLDGIGASLRQPTDVKLL